MLTGIAIGYSSVGRNQVALSVEGAKLSEAILQAKALSIATYGNAANNCGFGVSIDVAAQTYSIFEFHPSGAAKCPSASQITSISYAADAQQYTPGTWNIHVANGVQLYTSSNGDDLADVLFYPPDPVTLISRDGSNFMSTGQTSKVYLKTADGSAVKVISVSSAGQVEL